MDNEITLNYYAELCICSELPPLAITQAGTYEKLSFNQSENLMYGFSADNGTIVFQGSEGMAFTGYLLARVRSEEPSEARITIPKNGIIQEVTGGSVQATTDYKIVNASFEIELNPNDYLEIKLTKMQGTGNVQVKEVKVTMSRK
jgi:hypothetical protein